MKRIKILLLSIALLLFIFVFTGCDKTPEENETSTGYEYIPSGHETVTQSEVNDSREEKIVVDKSWQKNFSIEYEHYNSEESITTMKIKEKKADNAFTLEYVDNSVIHYFKANGNDTDYYLIIGNEQQQIHSLAEGEPFGDILSLFMQLSEFDENLPSQSNVLYMYEEEVAGRRCNKYIQRAYSGGKLTSSVYVWVDIEYGFIAKCEAYDENNIMVLMWKLTSFETGTLKDEDVFIDLTKYTFEDVYIDFTKHTFEESVG